MWFVKCAVGRGPRGRSTGGMGGPSARGHEVRVQGAQMEGGQGAQVKGVQGAQVAGGL